MLTSLSMYSKPHMASLYSDGENKKRTDALQASLSKSKYSTNKITCLSWAKYFDEGEWMNNPYQVNAFLASWLSYFVLLSLLEDGLHNFVFPLEVLLV